MIKRGMTIKEAAERWVTEFNRFPQDMIQKLMNMEPCSWREVTKPSSGRRVYVFNLPDGCEDYDNAGEIESYITESDAYIVNLDDGNTVEGGRDDWELNEYDLLPMWGWMWQFDDSADDYWLEEMGGIQIMSDCGFRIYESDDWGYFFGIDGAGYDFYESHWMPLYRKRGLQWHDPATELTEEKVSDILKGFISDERLIERLLKEEKGGCLKVGGYYGGFITKDQAQKIGSIGWFDVNFVHDTVLEMSGRQDNDYYVIRKEV